MAQAGQKKFRRIAGGAESSDDDEALPVVRGPAIRKPGTVGSAGLSRNPAVMKKSVSAKQGGGDPKRPSWAVDDAVGEEIEVVDEEHDATPVAATTKPLPAATASVSHVDNRMEEDDGDGEDGLARKAAAARAHREQMRQRAAFGSVKAESGSGGAPGVSGMKGGTSLSRRLVASAAGEELELELENYDGDSYSTERMMRPAAAADVAAIRQGLHQPHKLNVAENKTVEAARPSSSVAPSLSAWEEEQLRRAGVSSKSMHMPAAAVADTPAPQSAVQTDPSSSSVFPSCPDPSALLEGASRLARESLAAAQEAAHSAQQAASTAAQDASSSLKSHEALKAQLGSSIRSYDAYTELRRYFTACAAILRERGPLVDELISATARSVQNIRGARRKTRLEMATVPATQLTGGNAAALKVQYESLLARAVEQANGGNGSGSIAPEARLACLLSHRLGRLGGLEAVERAMAEATTTTSSSSPSSSLASLWDRYDLQDAIERHYCVSSCLQPLERAHAVVFEGLKPDYYSCEAVLKRFAAWKAGNSNSNGNCIGNGTGEDAVALAASYVRSFAYSSVPQLLRPVVLHQSWRWLLHPVVCELKAAAAASTTMTSPAAMDVDVDGATATAATAEAVAPPPSLALDSLPWFNPLWQYGEAPLLVNKSGTASSEGNSNSSSAGLSNDEVQAAVASDEQLLPSLVNSVLVPPLLELLPSLLDPFSSVSNTAVRASLASEVCIYDLPQATHDRLVEAVTAAFQGAAEELRALLSAAVTSSSSSPSSQHAAALVFLFGLGGLRVVCSLLEWLEPEHASSLCLTPQQQLRMARTAAQAVALEGFRPLWASQHAPGTLKRWFAAQLLALVQPLAGRIAAAAADRDAGAALHTSIEHLKAQLSTP